MICSYAAVLIKPQPPTKDLSKHTIEDPIPTPCHHSSWRSWCSVDFRVHTMSYNIPMRGMICSVSDAEHSDQWCVLDHNTAIHQHAPSNISIRYAALCYQKTQCDKPGKKTCFITFDQPLYIKVPSISIIRSIHELSSVVACLVGFPPLISFIDVMIYVMFAPLWAQQARR